MASTDTLALALVGAGIAYVISRGGSQSLPGDITVQMPETPEDAAQTLRTLSTGPQEHSTTTSSSGTTSTRSTTTGAMSAPGETTDLATREKRRKLFAGVDI